MLIDRPLDEWFTRNPDEKATDIEDNGGDALAEDREVAGQGELYLAAGQKLHPGESGADSLMAWVARGNTALFALRDLPHEIIALLEWYECDDWVDYSSRYTDSLRLGFYDEQTDTGTLYTYPYKNIVRDRTWFMLGQWFNCRYNALGENTRPAYLGGILPRGDGDSLANFFAAPYGEGMVFGLTTPLVLTNYHFKREDGLAYVEHIFQYLPDGAVHWDRFNQLHTPPVVDERPLSESPLGFVLAQPGLRWAWYLLLAIGLLYMLFRAKRRQAPIPVIDPKENRSMEFVDMVSLMHYQQNDHIYVAGQVRRQFLAFVRERYHLSTAELDDRFARELSAKSEIPQEEVHRLVRLLAGLDQGSGEPEYTLTRLHERVHDFMARCT
jgi:hypothetical protein